MIHSIKCRICTCRMTTVRLAQPDRDAKDLQAQKECSEFVARLKLLTQDLFGLTRRGASEGRSVTMNTRLTERAAQQS